MKYHYTLKYICLQINIVYIIYDYIYVYMKTLNLTS